MKDRPLIGKVALITGGAHRVGRAITLAIAAAGCDVAVHFNRSRQAASETVEAARAFGVEAHAFQADLRSEGAINELFNALDARFDRLDFLINSAAIMERIPFMQATPQDWSRTMDLNLRAVFLCTQHAAKRMRQVGRGTIVNISDIAALKPWRDYPVHSISKAGLEMLTRVAARALAPDIRVNAIAPGPVLKPDRMSEERWREIGERLPLRRPGTADDVAQAVLFLLENAYITGETLTVDGGDHLI